MWDSPSGRGFEITTQYIKTLQIPPQDTLVSCSSPANRKGPLWGTFCIRGGCGIRNLQFQYPNWIIYFVPHKLSQSGFESRHAFVKNKSYAHILHKIKTAVAVNIYFAEDVGFEPTRTFLLWRFSKPLPSATRPILRAADCNLNKALFKQALRAGKKMLSYHHCLPGRQLHI
jgi:hypothetical protein